MLCFIRTSPFRVEDAQYSRSITVPLRRPSNDSHVLVQAALRGLQALYRPGYRYAKAGVMLLDLSNAASHQFELDLQEPSADEKEKRTQLMQTLDGINHRYGRGTVQLASAGLEGNNRMWSMRQERKTPGYTTRWNELVVARA